MAFADAQIAQLVEQRTENPRVTGSIPVLGTSQAWFNGRTPAFQAGYVGSIPIACFANKPAFYSSDSLLPDDSSLSDDELLSEDDPLSDEEESSDEPPSGAGAGSLLVIVSGEAAVISSGVIASCSVGRIIRS